MAFYDLLHKFNYIEANNLKALLPGFVVAQMEVAKGAESDLCVEVNGKKFVENGTICTISPDGICAWAEGKVMFVAYNDPLNTIINDDQYYATDIESENPRLVQLIPGDEFMANIDNNPDSPTYGKCLHKGLQAAIDAKWLVVLDENNGQSKDNWFAMHTMPNGEPGLHLMYLGHKAA